MFTLRNALELCLKRIFYIKVKDGVNQNEFHNKRKSHLLKKDLWKATKPVIEYYAIQSNYDIEILEIVENMIININSLDKNGDAFRYPTEKNLNYKINNITFDIKNAYEYFMSLINFLDSCGIMLNEIADYQGEYLSYF